MTTTSRLPAPHRARSHALLLALVVFLGMVLVLAAPAGAHDYIVESTPAHEATYDTLPERIEIEFSAEIIPASPAMLMLDASGNVIWETIPELEGRTAVTEFPVLNDGAYTLAWSLVSSDGHRVEGGIPFTVTAGHTDGLTASDAPASTDSAAEGTPAEHDPGPLDDVPSWAKILIGVAVVGGAATLVITTLRRKEK